LAACGLLEALNLGLQLRVQQKSPSVCPLAEKYIVNFQNKIKNILEGFLKILED